MALTVLVIDDEDPIRLLCRVNLEADVLAKHVEKLLAIGYLDRLLKEKQQ